MVKTCKTFLMSLIIGSSALATVAVARVSAVPGPAPEAVLVDRGIRVAQATELPSIKPSALRRMTFYSDKAITALFDLAKEDLAAGQGGPTISTDTTDNLRTAIERLLDAGEKADLTVDEIALFFTQQVRERFSGPIPFILQDANGNLDATELFRGIEEARGAGHNMKMASNYMALLNAEAAQLAGESGGGDTGGSDTPALAPPQEAPVAAEPAREYTEAEQAILDRVEIVNGERTIVAQPGDTLAAFAAAFYGDTLLYRKIYLANETVMRSPNVVEVGQRLKIPE